LAQEPSQNIFALLDRKPAVDLDQGLVLPTPLRGEIVFENVRFAYTPGKDVLQVPRRLPPTLPPRNAFFTFYFPFFFFFFCLCLCLLG
jgi:hypothetical protein